MNSFFRLIKSSPDSRARTGELVTAHGKVATPVFVPVGTQAAVKSVTPDELKEIGFNLVLANAYHLYLRPGTKVIEKFSGLHRFMGWDRAILTDSGGFQIFSLARLREVTDEGVTFYSHIDGSQHFFTPERVMQLEESLGADIIMALDICPSFTDTPEKIKQATERTHRWAERCLKAHKRDGQALFGITQGGFTAELRRESARFIASLGFPGFAIGGICVGEPKELSRVLLDETINQLPEDKPRHLLGVGAPEDIVNGVWQGVDMFDCALPTRVARNGAFFTWQGRRDIENTAYSQMAEPLLPDCDCYSCRHFSAAYLHHLFKSRELLAYRLLTIHNLSFMNSLVVKIRDAVNRGTFKAFRDDFLTSYRTTDDNARVEQKRKWLEAQGRPDR